MVRARVAKTGCKWEKNIDRVCPTYANGAGSGIETEYIQLWSWMKVKGFDRNIYMSHLSAVIGLNDNEQSNDLISSLMSQD